MVWPAGNREARVRDVSLHALSRAPSPAELAAVLPFLAKQTELHRTAGHNDAEQQAFTDYCQSLFGLNEFLYVP